MERSNRIVLGVFALCLLLRVASIVFTLTTGLNPYAQSDVFGFMKSADQIANLLMNGRYTALVSYPFAGTYQKWGLLLSPFWLLPGPSRIYAGLVNSVLASVAITNVYVLARYVHSRRAGLLAVAPLGVYPSIVLVQGTVLRESAILFGLTTATVLIFATRRLRLSVRTLGAIGGLWLTTFLRPENMVVLVAAIILGLAAFALRTEHLSWNLLTAAGVACIPLVFVVRDEIAEGLDYLAATRAARAYGRTAYLPMAIPRDVLSALAISWIGAAYFLFGPFPWMIGSPADLVVAVEGLVSLGFAVAAVFGVRTMLQRRPAMTVGLVGGFLLASLLYGLGSANMGTAVRHRQMFLWIIFLFGGIGLAERVRFRVGGRNET